MLLIKCCIAFSAVSIAYFLSLPFSGDVLDREYVKQNKLSQIIKTDSSEATKGMVFTTTYKFNNEGLVIEKKEAGKDVLTTIYTYDDKGNLIDAKTTHPTGAVVITEKMVYDMNSRLKECEIRKIAEKVTISEKMEWVDNNTMQTTRVANGATSRFLTQFDSKKRMIDQTFENGSGTSVIYDGDIILMKKSKAGAPNIERYEYDNQSRVNLIENSYSRKTFQYNPSGKLTATRTENEVGQVMAWERFEYMTIEN